MWNAFRLAVGQTVRIYAWLGVWLFTGPWPQFPRRLLLTLVLAPGWALLQVSHWLGFAADEVLFRRYRRQPVRAPLLVTGIPRSGTTHLQRVLVRHPHLTAMQTWECLLAPSICERYLWRALGRTLGPLASGAARRLPVFRTMAAIHPLGLREAEEDFLALLPVNACFLLVVLFPERDACWRLADFDRAVPDEQRQVILGFYRRLVQKHLFFHGGDRRYLSKNPSFTGWLDSLRREFPDGHLVLCTRPASAAVPSQLSALAPGWRVLHGTPLDPGFELRLVDMLVGFYDKLARYAAVDDRCTLVPMDELMDDLDSVVRRLLAAADLPLTDTFGAELAQAVAAADQYRSPHRYRRQDFSLRWVDVAHRFRTDSPRGVRA